MEKAEFDAMLAEGNNHKAKWKGEKYRMTVTTSSKVTGRPATDYSSKMIFEFGPSMESRSVTTSVFGPNPASTRESMRIGNWVYSRSGNDPWTRKEYAAQAPTKENEESAYQVLSSQTEYRYLGEGKLIDKPVQMFAQTNRQKKVNQKTAETYETESRTTYWVDANGMILKSEFIADNRGKNTSQTLVNTDWQLDPSITFAAPEIVP